MKLADAMRVAGDSKIMNRDSSKNLYAVEHEIVKDVTYFELKHVGVQKLYRSVYPARLKAEDIQADDWNVSRPEFELK